MISRFRFFDVTNRLLFNWETLVKKHVDSYSENSWKHVVSSILVFNIHFLFIQSKLLWRSKSIQLILYILVKILPCWNWSKTCSWTRKQVILRLDIWHQFFKLKPRPFNFALLNFRMQVRRKFQPSIHVSSYDITALKFDLTCCAVIGWKMFERRNKCA